MKQQLLDSSRRDISRKNPNYSGAQVEKILADELNYRLDGEKINPQTISVEKLWDSSEDHARSWYQRWVWLSLEE